MTLADQRYRALQGSGKDQLATPFADIAELVDQFGLQIPRQRQYDIGTVIADPLRVVGRDPRPGGEAAMPVRIAVHDVLEEIAADPAVVEQGCTGAPRLVADHPLAVGAALKQK